MIGGMEPPRGDDPRLMGHSSHSYASDNRIGKGTLLFSLSEGSDIHIALPSPHLMGALLPR